MTITPTEVRLMALHRSAVLNLAEIAERYLGVGAEAARRHAMLGTLPFPTFRASDNRKAPFLVRVDVARQVLHAQAEAAKREWEKAQV